MLVIVVVALGCVPAPRAADGKILKVLPQYLDREGRHSLSPSLYERDAYQAYLRRNLRLQSTMRFAVQWQARSTLAGPLKLRLELRTSHRDATNPYVLELPVPSHRRFSRWSTLVVDPAVYRQIGDTIAWRVTLWGADRELAEQKSFLW